MLVFSRQLRFMNYALMSIYYFFIYFNHLRLKLCTVIVRSDNVEWFFMCPVDVVKMLLNGGCEMTLSSRGRFELCSSSKFIVELIKKKEKKEVK